MNLNIVTKNKKYYFISHNNYQELKKLKNLKNINVYVQ